MTKVLYDYQAFTWQRFGGVSNCFVQLIKNLPTTTKYQIGIKECDNIHLREGNIVKCDKTSITGDNFLTNSFFPGKYRLYRYFSNIFPSQTTLGKNSQLIRKLLLKGEFDIFHPTFFHPYFLKYLGNKPFILTIHDMIPEIVYENHNDPQVQFKRLLAPKAAHIIAVSEKTKEDIIELLHIPSEKISVIYHGCPNINYPKEKHFEFNYILFVGGRNLPYKNFIPMLKAIAPVIKNHNLKLVCTGSPFSIEELQLFEEIGLVDYVVHEYVDDAGIMNLYHNAICFIFPSLYEGFGIPILEAYQAGCPVLLNKKSCFPEIAGDAAVYFDLDEYNNTLSETLENFILSTKDQKDKLINRQFERAKLYSWALSGERLGEVYNRVIKEWH